jgi:hypothetical protein
MAERLEALEICQVGVGPHVCVQAIIDSEVVGVSKPDPRIFHMALEALDSVPEAALHVGDSVFFDVNGAKAAGIEGVHVDPYRLCGDASHKHIRRGSTDDETGRAARAAQPSPAPLGRGERCRDAAISVGDRGDALAGGSEGADESLRSVSREGSLSRGWKTRWRVLTEGRAISP